MSLGIALAIGIGVGAAGASAALSGDDGDPVVVASSPSSTVSTTPATSPTEVPEPSPPAPSPDPDGQYESSCDYLLGNFTNNTPNGYRFIAQARLHNTGNIGIVLEVTAKWFQVGTNPVTAVEEVELEVGQRKTVNFTEQVSANEIDLIQAVDLNQDQCSVKARIIDNFGEPQ